MENTMLNDIKEVLYSEAYIDSMVKRVGAEISRDYADKNLLLVSGTGEVIEPDDGVLAIGSGGNYALSAARALLENTALSAPDIAYKSLKIAADICVFTNDNIIVETV